MTSPRQNWHREDVKAAVRKTGIFMRDLALRYGLNPAILSHCLWRPIPAGNYAIAVHLDRSVHDIWPEWYGPDGERLPKSSDVIRRRAALQRQKSARFSRTVSDS